MRDQLRKTTDENQRFAHSLAMHKAGMDDAQRHANRLEHQLRQIIAALKQIDPRCAALPVEDHAAIPDYCYRMPSTDRDRFMRIYDEARTSFAPQPIQQITHFLLYDRTLQNELAKTLHFRVKNAPGRQDFMTGYAVSEHMLRAMHHPEDVTHMVCRQFGHAIHRALTKKA